MIILTSFLCVGVHSLILIPLVSDRDRWKNRATVIFYRRKSHFSSTSRTGSEREFQTTNFSEEIPRMSGRAADLKRRLENYHLLCVLTKIGEFSIQRTQLDPKPKVKTLSVVHLFTF